MILKKLELRGFKTFRDRTVIEFTPGITAIVGPNGCGKSNIVDALRWVMGEQRVRLLRGKKADDVIFNGADGSLPLGMAEVTMTLKRGEKPFPGKYAALEEITLMRRLYREGESEYAINGVPCRLLDVRDFLMDAGVGTRTYSLVEQNSIITLIEASPEERRLFIEDAAGIVKYKTKKEIALRKMEATKQNLLRIHDVMREVKAQLNSLSRQAKRAEQYRTLKKEYWDVELKLVAQTFGEIRNEVKLLMDELETIAKEEFRLKMDYEAQEAAFSAMKVAFAEKEEERLVTERNYYECKNIIAVKEQAIMFATEKVLALKARRDRVLSEIEAKTKKIGEVKKEIEALSLTVEREDKELKELKGEIEAKKKILDEEKKVFNELNDEVEKKRTFHVDLAMEKSKLKNMLTNYLKFEEEGKTKIAKYERESEEVIERKKKLEGQRENLGELLKGLQKEKIDAYRDEERLTREIEETKLKIKRLEERFSLLREEITRKTARLNTLEAFHKEYRWCNEGVKAIFEAHKGNSDSFLGLVVEHIDVPKEYEQALEAVLGEKLQYILVKTPEDGERAIAYLKKTARGRGAFIPLSLGGPRTKGILSSPIPGERLIEKIEVSEDLRGFVTYLLEDVYLIPDLSTAKDIWMKNGFMGTFVTLEGDLLEPHGSMVGGRMGEKGRSLLGEKREIRELKAELNELEKELQEVTQEKGEVGSLFNSLECEFIKTKGKLHQLELRIGGAQKDLERCEGEMKNVVEREELLQFELRTFREEVDACRIKKENALKELSLLEKREKELTGETEHVRERLISLKKQIEEKEEDYTTLKVTLAKKEEKRVGLLRTIDRLKDSLNSLEREVDNLRKEASRLMEEITGLEEKIREDKKELEVHYQEFGSLEQVLGIKNEEVARASGELEEKGERLKHLKNDLELLLQKKRDMEILYKEREFQLAELKKGIYEKHQLDIESVWSEIGPLTEEEHLNLMERFEKTKEAINNFGEVNLLALQEVEELKGRYEFLVSQEADVRNSLNSLQEAIDRMNKVSRTLFKETLEAVKESFGEMIDKIFPGGKGELYLTDENLLECGVDIDIRIPGKRTRNVSLLSGGEKALSAIAFIFAILKCRPSPFVILDEVDAALDDANVSLFNKLLKEISRYSQIIVVTHNKRTMEVAHNLYGITMERPGISSLISVSIN